MYGFRSYSLLEHRRKSIGIKMAGFSQVVNICFSYMVKNRALKIKAGNIFQYVIVG